MVFKIGDRVTWVHKPNIHVSGQCEILEASLYPHKTHDSQDRYDRYKIRKIGQYNVVGAEVETWVSSDDIKIDTEYYRDLKIKELLNGNDQ